MKKILIIVGVVVVIGVLASGISDVQESFQSGLKQGRYATQGGTTGTEQSQNMVENNSQVEIEKAVRDIVDEQHLKEMRVVPVAENYAFTGGKYNVVVEFYEDDAGNLAANAVKLKSTEIFASLFMKDLGVNEAWTMAWYPTSSNPQMVLKTKLDREIAQEIGKDSKMVFQYDAERQMITEKSSFAELPVSQVTPRSEQQNLQGTDNEKEIFKYAMSLYNNYSGQFDSYEAERKSTQETADHFGISTDEVEQIVYKLQ